MRVGIGLIMCDPGICRSTSIENLLVAGPVSDAACRFSLVGRAGGRASQELGWMLGKGCRYVEVRSKAMKPSCSKCRSVVKASERRRLRMRSIELQSVRL